MSEQTVGCGGCGLGPEPHGENCPVKVVKRANELSEPKVNSTDLLAAMGFEPCEFDPDECDKCHKLAPLYFGNKDYWDSREGDYWCLECIAEVKRTNDQFAKLMERQINEGG